MGKNISHLKIGSETYDLKPYAVCTTDKYEDTKYLSIDGFQTYEGAEVTIRFTEGNLYYDGFYLSINSVSKAVQIDNTQYHAGMIFPPNVTHTFRYVAGCWQIISYTGLYETIPCEYSDLFTFVEEELLLPGQTYKIPYEPTIRNTDSEYGDFGFRHDKYKVAYSQPFNIILTATSMSTFNEKCTATNISQSLCSKQHNTWEIWYSIHPIRLASWAGWGDWEVCDMSGEYYYFNDSVYTYNNGIKYFVGHTDHYDGYVYVKNGEFAYNKTIYYWNGAAISLSSWATIDEAYRINSDFNGVIYRMIDEYENDLPYDFKSIHIKCNEFGYTGYRPTFTVYNILDGGFGNDSSVNGWARNNKMGRYWVNGGGAINCNRFYYRSYGYSDYPESYMVCNNTFGNNCYSNIVVSSNNVFGNNCYQNKINSPVNGGNVFGNYCSGNEIYGYYNTFGNNCYNNKVGTNENNTSNHLSFGNNCYKNTINSGCSYSTFGNSCSNITLGNTSYSNKFGSDCNNITLGTNCSRNRFGIRNEYITLGNFCIGNVFGGSCNYIYFKTSKSSSGTNRNYCYYNIFDDNVDHIILYNTTSASSSYILRNAHVYQGYANSATYKYASISYNLTAKCIVRNSADTSVTLTT